MHPAPAFDSAHVAARRYLHEAYMVATERASHVKRVVPTNWSSISGVRGGGNAQKDNKA